MHKYIYLILKLTKEQVRLRKKKISLEKLNQKILLNRGLSHIFLTKLHAVSLKRLGIIAEIKLASPSAGVLGDLEYVEDKVLEYKEAQVDAISIVTEKNFFKGSLDLIKTVKKVVNLPILQKDFIVDSYQIYEAKAYGSNALLLITRILDEETLINFVDICFEIGLDPVVEVNSLEDLEKALKTKTAIIAVNSRDLDTFKVDIDYACKLLRKIPEEYIKLGFSGVNSKIEARLYQDARVDAILIGTKLMKEKNIKTFIEEIRSDD